MIVTAHSVDSTSHHVRNAITHQGKHHVEVVDHQIHYNVDISDTTASRAHPPRIDRQNPLARQRLAELPNCRVESLHVADLEHHARVVGRS